MARVPELQYICFPRCSTADIPGGIPTVTVGQFVEFRHAPFEGPAFSYSHPPRISRQRTT